MTGILNGAASVFARRNVLEAPWVKFAFAARCDLQG